MQDYILFPKHIKQLRDLHSNIINELSENSTVIEDKISLDFLRKLYAVDRNRFLNVRDELLLRGFTFHLAKPNSILPYHPSTISIYIEADSNQNRYQQLDFSLLGLSGFDKRFNVESDLFFHRIPIDSFILLNRNLDVHLLESEFIKAGFALKHVESTNNSFAPGRTSSPDISQEVSSNNDNKVLTKIELFFLHTPVRFIFDPHHFASFLEFCDKENLQDLASITSETIHDFEQSYGSIEAETVLTLKERMNEIYVESLNVLKEKFPIVHIQSETSYAVEVGALPIKKIFMENKYNRFLDFCREKGIMTIGEIDQNHLNTFAGDRGIGFKKVQDVFDTLQQLLLSYSNGTYQNSEPSDGELVIALEFKENKYNTFRKFCTEKGIELISDITDAYLNEFSKSKGVGMGRYNIVKEKLQEYDAFNPSPPQVLKGMGPEIDSLFVGNKYESFLAFCKVNGIQKVGDLTVDHMDEFSKTPQVGKRKVENIKTILKAHSWGETLPEVIEFKDGELYEELKDYKVTSLMNSFGINGAIESQFLLYEIEGMDLEEVQNYFPIEMIMSLLNKFKFASHPSRIGEVLHINLQGNQYQILQYRYGDKLTLEETGEKFGLTRERVRQIAKKAISNVNFLLEKHYLFEVAAILASSRSLIASDELLVMIGKEHQFIIEMLKEGATGFTYFKKLDTFFFAHEKEIDFTKLDDFIDDLPSIFFLHEYESLLEEILESLGVEEPELPLIQSLLEDYGFKTYGELYSRRKLTIVDVLEILFSTYIKGSLLVDEEGFELIQNLAKKHLNYEFTCTLRSMDARLRDSGRIILVESNTFQWFDEHSFDQALIKEIDKYLQERFIETDVINIEEVFNHFKDRIEPLEINTKVHLYSIVKYYLDGDYTIGKGNTLNIFRSDAEKLNIDDSLVRAMEQLGGYCTKDELNELLRWQQFKMDLGISSSRKILSWGKNKVILFEKLGLTESDKASLTEFAQKKLLLDGYTTTGSLLNDMKFNPHLAPLISKKGIDDSWKLSSVLKILMPELKGHSNFLYVEGSEVTSFEEVMIKQFDRETTRKELLTFAIENGYKEMMANNLLKKLLDQRIFVEIDLGKLYPNSKLNVSEETLKELVGLVEEARGRNEYVSLSILKGFKRRLPHIGFRWNPFLMKSILVEHGYRSITKIMSDYRYDKIVLVKEDSPIRSFEELVHFILKHEYSGNMHERSVYDFLVEKGIFKAQDSPSSKVLPHELKNIDNLVNVDELGIVSLR